MDEIECNWPVLEHFAFFHDLVTLNGGRGLKNSCNGLHISDTGWRSLFPIHISNQLEMTFSIRSTFVLLTPTGSSGSSTNDPMKQVRSDIHILIHVWKLTQKIELFIQFFEEMSIYNRYYS